MKRLTLTSGCIFILTAAALTAQQTAEMPHYVAVELTLDGAVRDAGASGRSELGSRKTAAGETHAIVRRGDQEVDLHPAGAVFSQVIAGDADIQAGSAGFEAHSHAIVWQGSAQSAEDLHGFLPQGYTDSIATGIDDAGNVSGVGIDGAGRSHDILWRTNRTSSTVSVGGGATYRASGGSGGSGGGGGNTGGGGGGTVTTDKVSITRALWFGNPAAPPTGTLLVQATSSRQDAVLTMTDTDTGAFIATLPNLGGGQYGGTVIFRFNPVTSVTVVSSLGGSKSRAVILGVQ